MPTVLCGRLACSNQNKHLLSWQIWVSGIIIKPISPHDWAWSRLIPFMGFPVIKTHDWGCFGGLGTPKMDSPGRGACFRTQKLGLGTPKMDSPGRGACFRTQKLGLGTPKMDSPGRGACSGHKNLDLGLQKWIPPVGAPASGHKSFD